MTFKKGHIKYNKPKPTIDLTTPEGRNRFYQTPEWRALRYIVLTEEIYCKECLKDDIYTVATEVDHIVDIKDDISKFFTRENLQTLCKSCHSSKTFHSHTSIQNKGKMEVVNKKWQNLKIS